MSRYQSSRRSRRDTSIPWAWIGGGIALLAVIAGLFALPVFRAQVRQGEQIIARQVQEDFGVPHADRRILVVHLLDHSGSSRYAKQDILDQVLLLSAKTGVTASTMVWRYSNREELIYEGVNKERLMKPALIRYYKNVEPASTSGTHLGAALSAANAAIIQWQKKNPQGLVYLTIGTDGGIEDVDKTQRLAGELAKRNVFCLVHGVLVEQRLREQVTNALRPLERSDRLYICNKEDFPQVSEEFAATVKSKLPTPVTGTQVARKP